MGLKAFFSKIFKKKPKEKSEKELDAEIQDIQEHLDEISNEQVEEVQEVVDESNIRQNEEKTEDDVIENYIALININKIYDGGVQAVYDFNLEVKEGEFVVFVGPSGCGKSTTLRMIAGIEDITSGELYMNGYYSNDVTAKDRNIAMVFQNYSLYPNMTVYDNMAFALKVRKTPKEEIKRRVTETAEILGIENLLKRKPKALSGGQRQRVALGRAIVREANVFLMDEPLSNLDAKLRVQMRSEIIRLHNQFKTTTIYVTHDQTEAMTMADRIVVMKDGYIQQIGTPIEIYRHPVNKFVASFIGSPAMNFVKGIYSNGIVKFEDGSEFKLSKEVNEKYATFYSNLDEKIEKLTTKLDGVQEKLIKYNEHQMHHRKLFKKVKLYDVENDKEVVALKNAIELCKQKQNGEDVEVVFGIRPEDIKLSSSKESFVPEIKISELLGDSYFVHFDYGGVDVVAKVMSDELINTSSKINLAIDPKKVHLFDPYTEEAII